MTDYRLTILTPKGSGLARKHIFADGTIRQADNIAKFFHASEDISTPEKLLRVIEQVAGQNAAIIRGEPACDRQPLHRQKAHVMSRGKDRGDEGFIEVPRAWLSLDIDGMTLPPLTDWREGMGPVVEHAVGLLPEAFQDAKIIWQVTSSHGLEFDAAKRWTGRYVGETARLRLWVLLDRPISSDLAEAWTMGMAGPLKLDASVSRTVQMNYVARPTTDAGTDPLHPFIAQGIPVVGLRDGLDDYVSVPDGIEVEAKWARAEGRAFQCASHPSAAAAISAVGTPRQGDARGEIRSHLTSAIHHIVSEEQKAKRQPSAGTVAEAVRSQVLEQREAIEVNLSAHGRSWGEVLAYLDGYHLEAYAQWLIDKGPSTRGGDGGGKRKTVRRIPQASTAHAHSINVVSIAEIRAKCVSAVDEFIRQDTAGYWTAVAEAASAPVNLDIFGNPIVLQIVPPRRMLAVSTGAGKTEAAIGGILDYIAAERASGTDKAAYLAVPHHKLSRELVGRIETKAGQRGMAVKVARWLGRKQPDPLQPGQTMCQRPEDLDIVERFKLPVAETLCASGKGEDRIECPLAGVCGYKRQVREAADADIVIIAHKVMTQGLPASLPDPGVLFVDEAAWKEAAGGCDSQAVKVSMGAMRRKTAKSVPDELRWARVELAKIIEEEADGGIRAEALQSLERALGAMGLRPGDVSKLEYQSVAGLSRTVVNLSGAALESALQRDLGEASGIKAARQMGHLWSAIADASALPAGTRSGRLELLTTDAENDLREIRIRWKEELAECWSKVPILFMDATADATVLDAAFPGVTPAPRYVAHNPHVKIRQLADRSMSHAAIAPKTADDVTQRNNAKKVKARLISEAIHRYPGQPVVAIVPEATEKVWREDPIPSWLSILHHGAVTGLDDYGSARAVYVVGRMLPSAAAVEAMAGAITGIAPASKGYRETKRELVCEDGSGVIVDAWEHPDPLCEAIRRQITEAGIIQAAGRGRGTNRTAAHPLDLILWTDTPVPELGFVEAETWEGATLDDGMLAAGCWIDLPADAARVHPEIVPSPSALKWARQRAGSDISLYRTSISKCHHPWRYRPEGKTRTTAGTAVFLTTVSEAEARAYLEAKLGPLALLEALGIAAASADLQPVPETPADTYRGIADDPVQTPASAAEEDAGQPVEVEDGQTLPLPEEAPPAPSLSATGTVDLADYRGGIMPKHIAAAARALQPALGVSQEGLADLIGISRPQLANALQGRYGLSEAAAGRLTQLLRHPPPIRQPDLFTAIH